MIRSGKTVPKTELSSSLQRLSTCIVEGGLVLREALLGVLALLLILAGRLTGYLSQGMEVPEIDLSEVEQE
jgi:hypothetical protein